MKNFNFAPFLFFFFALLTMNVHCEKEDPDVLFEKSQAQLPPITFTGANTFGCTINGENWVAYTDYSFPKLMVDFNTSSGTLGIKTYRRLHNEKEEKNDALQLFVYKLFSKDTYFLGKPYDTISSSGYCGYSSLMQPWPIINYTTTYNHTGKVSILYLNEMAHIISGTFEADIIYYDSTVSDSVIKIRNGRFDVNY